MYWNNQNLICWEIHIASIPPTKNACKGSCIKLYDPDQRCSEIRTPKYLGKCIKIIFTQLTQISNRQKHLKVQWSVYNHVIITIMWYLQSCDICDHLQSRYYKTFVHNTLSKSGSETQYSTCKVCKLMMNYTFPSCTLESSVWHRTHG